MLALIGGDSAGAKTPVIPSPDLQVTSISPGSRVATAGESLNVKDAVRNRGAGKAAASVLEYVLSADSKRDKGDRRVGTRRVDEIAPGARQRGNSFLDLPQGLAAKQMFLIACADATGKVAELKERNNCSQAPLAIQRPAVVQPTPPATLSDTSRPVVVEVSSTLADGSYPDGTTVPISMRFTESVLVTGAPRILLETGATDRSANYTSGSGTSTLNFLYTVTKNDTTPDLAYQSTGALTLGGGSIRDLAGNDAALTLPVPGSPGSLGAIKSIAIDGVYPTVTEINSPDSNGTYGTDSSISILVKFSEPMLVNGTPQLLMETGVTDHLADYEGGSGTTTLLFSYTVMAGDTSLDLDYHDNEAFKLNGGTIKDIPGNGAQLTLPAPGTPGSLASKKALLLDGIGPGVTNVTASSSMANGTYGTGASVPIEISFSEPVMVTGIPKLLVETGVTDYSAEYESGSGSAKLTFRYRQKTGNTSLDLDYHNSGALTLNGGTIKDNLGNSANLALPSPGAPGSLSANRAIVLTGVPPAVTNVSIPNFIVNGTYQTGTLGVEITFSEAVVITGTPQLLMETGATDRLANYVVGDGSGDPKKIFFLYTIMPGDTSPDLDYHDSGALTLNGGTIKDLNGNPVQLTLPAPGSPGSLAANRAIVINGI